MVQNRLLPVSMMVIVTLALANGAFAQGQVSGIAGNVKDTTGAVLPGVSIEVSSPALIEKTRTVVTDMKGEYKVVDLVTGTYTVTFSLPGFAVVKREGIQLTAAFTATVNAELRVGAVEESVTVSGASPMVDTHNDVQQKPITSQMIADLPSGRLQQGYAAMVPEITIAPNLQDVGGSKGETTSGLQVHNSRAGEMADLIEGLRYNSMMGPGGGGSGLKINMGAVEEINLGVSGNSAEYEMGGVQYNVIPKDGGNIFKGSLFANGTNGSLQGDNLDAGLQARGLRAVGKLVHLWDINPVLGGPLVRDKLWFFGGYRNWSNSNGVAGTYYNLTPQGFVYTPDYSHQGYDDTYNQSTTLRLTWQASPKNKIAAFFDDEVRCTCHVGISTQSTSSVVSPEAAGYRTYPPDFQGQGTWTMPATSRLLFEAGGSATIFAPYTTVPEPGVAPDTMSVLEASTGVLYRAAAMYRYHTLNHTFNFRGSASYVTGSHAFKVGFQTQSGTRWEDYAVNSNIDLRLLNGKANQITEYATPFNTIDALNLNLGLFAQDQWTLKRLTLNVGLRFDYLHSSVPPQSNLATEFVPARAYPEVDVLHWKDVDPRLGVAYDLFGNGKTALKASVNRYVAGETTAFAHALNPSAAAVVSVTRTWTDPSGTFNPGLDCNLASPLANGGCGQISNLAFGSPLTNITYDPSVRSGWGVRNYNWDSSVGIQHEFKPGLSVNVAYARKSYGNPVANGAANVFGFATALQNTKTAPSDYSQYCVTAPSDPRLPNGGGYGICGLYDVSPAKFGQVQQYVTSQNWTELYNGVDASFVYRLGPSTQFSGGLTSGHIHLNTCTIVNSAQDLLYCDVNQPMQTQIKLNGVFSLPWQLRLSGVFQNMPGTVRAASSVFTNAQVAPSLGRNLAAGPNGTVTVQLFAPQTQFEPRWSQLDLRLSRTLKAANVRIVPEVDVYNLFNANPVLVMNTTYGPQWLQPTVVLPGRLFKFGVQLDF